MPVHKKGDETRCKTYRDISLINVAAKIFAIVLLRRIQSVCDFRARNNQAVFLAGRGCVNEIFTLTRILEFRPSYQQPTAVCCVDLPTAFDSALRESLWRIMAMDDVPGIIIAMIKEYYSSITARVLAHNNLSEPFARQSGIRKGCVPSSILFIYAIDWIPRKAQRKDNGIELAPGCRLTELDDGDYIALLVSSHAMVSRVADDDTFYSSLSSQPTAASNEDERFEPSPQPTSHLLHLDCNSSALRHRSGHRPNTSSTAYPNFCRFVIPQPASDASKSQAPSQSSASSSRNCSLEPSLPIRQLCPTDSPARLSFSQTFDLNVNVVEANINMHNASPVVEEEACTDVDIALFSSLGSEGGVSMNPICWKSMVSVSSPEEMRLHGPLPVRSTKDPRASSKVSKLRTARKKRAHWSLQPANELYEPMTFDLCIGCASCARQPRHSHKRKSNLKNTAVGVTGPFQVAATSTPIWGDGIDGGPAKPPRRPRSIMSRIVRIIRGFPCLRPSKTE